MSGAHHLVIAICLTTITPSEERRNFHPMNSYGDELILPQRLRTPSFPNPCANNACGFQQRCIPIEGKRRCIPIPDPCAGFRCAGDEQCVLDHGLPYCQKRVTSCPVNETRQECGSLCEGLCLITVLGGLTCGVKDICSWPSCACKDGYYRDAFGRCVLEEDCFPDKACFASPAPCKETEACLVENGEVICIPSLVCGANEVYDDCGSKCEPTCATAYGVRKRCMKVCTTPACVCKRGYFRKGAMCVPRRQCQRGPVRRVRPVKQRKDVMTGYGDEPFTL